MFGRIVLGLFIMILGGAMIYFSASLVEIFGRSRWAEQHLSGTRQLWMLIGFTMVIVGGLVMFGILAFSDPTDVSTMGFSGDVL